MTGVEHLIILGALAAALAAAAAALPRKERRPIRIRKDEDRTGGPR